MELSNANADPESLLSALHAERESAAAEARRRVEEEEDDAVVQQYFAKVAGGAADHLSKGKGKAVDDDGRVDGNDEDNESESVMPSLTIKRRPAPGTASGNGVGNGNGVVEPSVASLLAAKVGNGSTTTGTSENPSLYRVGPATDVVGLGDGKSVIPGGGVKRNREGMQKLLGIKKRVKV